MYRDMLIGEGAIHAFDNRLENARIDAAAAFLEQSAGLTQMISPPEARLPPDQWLRDFSAREVEEALFLESDVDFGVYHSLPVFDLFEDGWSSLEKGAQMRDDNPDRVKLHGCVDPLREDASKEMARQVDELAVDGFKMYPTYVQEGKVRPLRLDEELLPLVETARDLGIDHIAVHKLFPIGPVGLHHTSVGDVADVAGMFPDMTFELLHPDLAFLHEIASMLGTHPNVWVNIELTTIYLFLQPRRFAEVLGELLVWAPDRVVFGTGPPLVHPQGYVERFWEFEMPEDLQAGYNYPELTDDLKRGLLGENLIELYGWDEKQLRRAVETDRWSERREADGRPEPWAGIQHGTAAASD